VNKFIKKNWLKIGFILVPLIIFSLGLLYYLFYPISIETSVNIEQVKNVEDLSNQKRNELSEVQSKINTYSKVLEVKQSQKATLESQIEIVQIQIEQVKEKINLINKKIELAELELEKLEIYKEQNNQTDNIQRKQTDIINLKQDKVEMEFSLLSLEKELNKLQKSVVDTEAEEKKYQELLEIIEEEKQEENSNSQEITNFTAKEQFQAEEKEEDSAIKIEKCKITAEQQAEKKIAKYKDKNEMPTSEDYWDCVYKYDPTKDIKKEGIPIHKKIASQQQACQKDFEMMIGQYNQEVQDTYNQYYEENYMECLDE